MVGDYRSHRIEPRTLSHVEHTKCLIFGLSEILVTVLGTSVKLHQTSCKKAWEAK